MASGQKVRVGHPGAGAMNLRPYKANAQLFMDMANARLFMDITDAQLLTLYSLLFACYFLLCLLLCSLLVIGRLGG
jgi:hypothetical protein